MSFAQIDEGAFEEAAKSAHQVWTDQSTRGGELEKGLEFLVEIAGALQDGGAPEDLWMPLVESALDSVGERRDIIWARLRLLLPVKMKRLSRGRINAGRWLGADSKAIRIVREHGTARDYARTLWVYDWQTDGMTLRKYQISAEEKFYKQEYCGCAYSLRDSNLWRKKEGIPPVQIGGETAGIV